MNFVFTKHVLQRRPHHPIRTDEELRIIMEQLDAFYQFENLDNGKYYFLKKGKAAVFKKAGNTITLITMRGIHLTSQLNEDTLPPLKLEDPERESRRSKRKAIKSLRHKWMQYYPAVFEETSDGGYSVFFPDVPGCITAATDLEEAITMAKKAIAIHLSYMIEEGDPLPIIDLGRCKEIAKGEILVMIRPQKELLFINITA